jgi:hypothetical protein
MDFLRAILRQYWPNIVACAVFAFAVLRYWRLGNYLETRHLMLIVFAFGGLVAFVGSDEWAEYTGWYGLTRDQFSTVPSVLIRVVGGIVLVAATLGLFRL